MQVCRATRHMRSNVANRTIACIVSEELPLKTPHLSLTSLSKIVLEIGKVAKESVLKEGFLAWGYNTIGVSDGFTMGHQGKKKTRYLSRHSSSHL